MPPKVFISYSWDGDAHRSWVREFAARLRMEGGIDVTLDQWHAAPGDRLTSFMERAVRESDFVLVVCTPAYKSKSDLGTGGVGYEGDIMTGEVLTAGNHSKFVPILREGEWKDAAPSWLAAKYYVKLTEGIPDHEPFRDLLRTLHRARPAAPAVGTPPSFIENDLISIARDVLTAANEILDANQAALVPFFTNPALRYSVSNQMTALFHDQAYRSRFSGWRAFLGSLMQTTRDPEHLSVCDRLQKQIATLHSAFYTYQQTLDDKGEFETHKHFVELVLGNRASDPQWYCLPDDEVTRIAEKYLERIRTAVETLGAILGELQAQ